MPPQDGTPCIVGGLGAFWPGRPRTAPPDHSGTEEQPRSGLTGDTIAAPARWICHHGPLRDNFAPALVAVQPVSLAQASSPVGTGALEGIV